MPIYPDQFFIIDAGAPPPRGTALSVVKLDINDIDGNSLIQTGTGDLVGGLVVTSVWVNDRIRVTMGGTTQWVTGVTFYRSGGSAVFTPTDGTILQDAVFRRSDFVTTSTQVPVGAFGPPCFAAGTRIETEDGPRRVEELRPGDRIFTRDDGLQELQWTGHRIVPGSGDWAPIRFAKGAIGNDAVLLVSPQHRILVTGWRAELFFGEDEVLVAAKHLVNGDTICRAACASVAYYHLLFDRHQIVFSEGAATESLHPGDTMLRENPKLAHEIVEMFPELSTDAGRAAWKTARPTTTGREAMVLMAA